MRRRGDHDPLKTTGLEVLGADGNSNPADFVWDPSRQQLVVLKWPVDRTEMHVTIRPGTSGEESMSPD